MTAGGLFVEQNDVSRENGLLRPGGRPYLRARVMRSLLGRKQQAQGDPCTALVEGHERIRAFADLAVAIATREDAPFADVRAACARVERYFAVAMPLHVRDEEESIFPRLRGRSSSVDAALAGMHEQHVLHAGLIERLCRAVSAVMSGDELGRASLVSIAQPLRQLLEVHLRSEDEIVVPAMRELLSRKEQAAIRREMEARRRSQR